MLLEDRVVLVTGASRGIGAATARLLAAHGAAVAVNYLESEEKAKAVVDGITTAGGRAVAVRADVRDQAEVEAMVGWLADELGPIDTLVLNAAIMWAMRRDQRRDLNIRSAYLHMLGDALGSVGILLGSVLIRYTGWQRVDPVLSILIGALIVWTAWDVIREALNILLEGLPRGMDLPSVAATMRQVEGVLDIHDLHIWSLASHTHALSCHVLIADVPLSESEAVLRRINDELRRRFHIEHTTVQFEHANCALSGTGCSIVAPSNG